MGKEVDINRTILDFLESDLQGIDVKKHRFMIMRREVMRSCLIWQVLCELV